MDEVLLKGAIEKLKRAVIAEATILRPGTEREREERGGARGKE